MNYTKAVEDCVEELAKVHSLVENGTLPSPMIDDEGRQEIQMDNANALAIGLITLVEVRLYNLKEKLYELEIGADDSAI